MFEYLGLAYKDSDYIAVIATMHALADLNVNFGAETHLGGGDMSTFVSPSAAIVRPSTSVGSTVLRNGTQRFLAMLP